MSPETDANEHVPLEFLLGARAKNYFSHSSITSVLGRSSKDAKHILASSIHPRRREEQARHLLRRVLEHEDPGLRDDPPESAFAQIQPDKSAVLKSLVDIVSTSVLGEENNSNPPARIKTLQQTRDDDFKRQQQRDNSFHGYEQNQRSFLDVSGAAARIPHTTTRQIRDLKLNVTKAKKKVEAERKQDLLKTLQEQQVYTRKALRHHLQLSLLAQQQQQKDPRTVATTILALDSIEKQETGEQHATRTMFSMQYQDSYYDQKLLEEQQRSQHPVLTTFTFDARGLPVSPSIDRKTDTVDNEERPHSFLTDEDLQSNPDADDNNEQVRRRLGDRQRGVFANAAANGLFLGGGFISKKTTGKYNKNRKIKIDSPSNNSSNRLAREREFLETVLSAQSASILPLAEANKPALRRREASASRPNPHKPPDKK